MYIYIYLRIRGSFGICKHDCCVQNSKFKQVSEIVACKIVKSQVATEYMHLIMGWL